MGTGSSINNTLQLPLKGLNISTNSAITENDKVIDAFGKLQAQLTSFSSAAGLLPSNNTWTGVNTFSAATNSFSNLLGIATTAPTHSLTLSSTSTGWTHYNTSDQVTNYERLRSYWNGNIYNITTEAGGTGTVRQINVGTANRQFGVLDGANTLGFFQFGSSTSGVNASIFGINGTSSASSGIFNVLNIVPTINQSGTGGYRGIFISPYEQATGSGSKLLLDLGTNSAANGGGTHASKFSVDNAGNASTTGSINLTNDGQLIRFVNNGSNGQLLSSGGIFSITNSAGADGTDTFIIGNNAGGTRALRLQGAVIKFGLNASGTEYGRMFSTGNWFLGSSPVDSGYRLDVNGTARVSGLFTATSSVSAGLFQTSSGGVDVISLQSTNATGFSTIGFLTNTGAFAGSFGHANNNGSGVMQFFSSNRDMIFQTSGTAMLTLKASNNILIGTTTDVASSLLTLASTTKGFLPPRMTTAQRDAIVSPAEGLVVYNTTTKKLNVFTTIWEQLTSA